jgi:hypothetical protein
MYIITNSLYPNDKAKDVANMYLKMMTKYPDDNSLGNRVVPVAVRTTLEGIKVMTITEIKKGKLEDAMSFITNRLAMFMDIPGYRYAIKTYMNLEEALKTIGM